MLTSKRIGSIEVSQNLVHDFGLMSTLFSKFIPLAVNYDFIGEKFTYKGYCNEFDEIKEGDKIPFYNAVVNYNRDEQDYEKINISVSFNKL